MLIQEFRGVPGVNSRSVPQTVVQTVGNTRSGRKTDVISTYHTVLECGADVHPFNLVMASQLSTHSRVTNCPGLKFFRTRAMQLP